MQKYDYYYAFMLCSFEGFMVGLIHHYLIMMYGIIQRKTARARVCQHRHTRHTHFRWPLTFDLENPSKSIECNAHSNACNVSNGNASLYRWRYALCGVYIHFIHQHSMHGPMLSIFMDIESFWLPLFFLYISREFFFFVSLFSDRSSCLHCIILKAFLRLFLNENSKLLFVDFFFRAGGKIRNPFARFVN